MIITYWSLYARQEITTYQFSDRLTERESLSVTQ